MTVELAAEMLALSIQDLRSFAADVRQVAGNDEGMLAGALRVVALAAEETAARLARGDEPGSFSTEDMMVIMMLAGYTTGAGGITQAKELIGTVIDEHEREEDPGEHDGS